MDIIKKEGMGYCYRDGEGVRKNSKKAREYFELAYEAIKKRMDGYRAFGDEVVLRNIERALGKANGKETAVIKVYCYDKCSTCKKALKWLDDNKVKYKSVDIKEDHPDEKTLRSLQKKSGLPLKKFFNTSGMLYRDMGLSKKLPTMTDDDMYKLLASDGMLVKRPLLITDKAVIPGFREETWKDALR